VVYRDILACGVWRVLGTKYPLHPKADGCPKIEVDLGEIGKKLIRSGISQPLLEFRLRDMHR